MSGGFLFDPRPPLERDQSFSTRPQHDGPDLEPRDQRRLGTLQDRVVDLMADGQWRTLRAISDATGGSEASVSARLRDCRKEKFQQRYGELEVERRRRTEGTWEYRVLSR